MELMLVNAVCLVFGFMAVSATLRVVLALALIIRIRGIK